MLLNLLLLLLLDFDTLVRAVWGIGRGSMRMNRMDRMDCHFPDDEYPSFIAVIITITITEPHPPAPLLNHPPLHCAQTKPMTMILDT